MKGLVPNAFFSPAFPRVPKRIVKPVHPSISAYPIKLEDDELKRLRTAAGIAASARLLAQRFIQADVDNGKISSYLRCLVTDEYVQYLRERNSFSQELNLSSSANYIDILARSRPTTHAVDLVVGSYLVSRGAYPSGVGFMGFPRAACISVNEVVAHGIPDLRPLEKGDILNVDVTCYKDGLFGDCSGTFGFHTSDEVTLRFISAPQELVKTACSRLQVGMSLFELADLMDKERSMIGPYHCVSYFCGHSIGKSLHEKPNIFHTLKGLNSETLKDLKEERLRDGQVITIEPILVEQGGDPKGVIWPDGWTWVTADGSRTAQHEEMVLISELGPEIFTVPDDPYVGLG